MSLLQVENLTKKYGKSVAVNKLTFDISEGRCVALLGPNGAGKTTTLKMLSGLLAPTDGTIRFKGAEDIGDIREWIGYLPQYPAFYSWMTGHEFIKFAGQLARLSKKEAVQRALDLLELVGLQEAKNRRIGAYSGGMKQRLGLAQAMIHKPKLLILDEPVSALDPLGRREVLELMQELKRETTILFSTHVLHDAEEICDDILLIRSGEIAIQGDLKKVMQDYRQPIIYIQTEETCEAWLQLLSDKPYVDEIIYEHNTIKIIVNNLKQAKILLLQEVVEHNIPIVKFEAGRTTLEDLYIKVVKSS